AKTRLKKCEEEIELTETEIAEIEENLATSDYEELMRLTSLLDEKTTLRDSLYDEWENLTEQLTQEDI
ncbi:MAG: hypothetical protein E7571_08410, partial [Ruminococcaceae bacterium]|nr:hypothetical protein [Oscillospiraceae bacterium]